MFVKLQLAIAECSIADVLYEAGLREDRIEDANGLGPVPGGAELRELSSLGDGGRRHGCDL